MAESLIVIRTDEQIEERRHTDLLEEIDRFAEMEQLGDVRTTIGTRVVDARWAEGDECPECEAHNFNYLNVEDRRVASADGLANIKGMERHYAVLHVECVSCGHVVRSSPAVDIAQFEGVPITDADLDGESGEEAA